MLRPKKKHRRQVFAIIWVFEKDSFFLVDRKAIVFLRFVVLFGLIMMGLWCVWSFPDENICEEGARLWIAGYKMGNHRIIPNTEVPAAFLETGFCALSACDAKEGQAV